jgi:ABC-type uncharacterized transport system auxiliary subunit
MSKPLKSLVLLLLLSACSMSMPETRIYTLYMPAEEKTAHAAPSESIAIQISSESYLKQPYIAKRSSPYEMEILKYSKWESSPDKIVKNKIREALSSSGLFKEVKISGTALPDFYLLKINLKNFEMINEDKGSFALLEFSLALLSPDGNKLYQGAVSKKTALVSSDLAGLAKALSNALEQGAEETRDNITGAINK